MTGPKAAAKTHERKQLALADRFCVTDRTLRRWLVIARQRIAERLWRFETDPDDVLEDC